MEGLQKIITVSVSVADPDPNPEPDLPDPHVFGPPGSGSGSFYHQAKKNKKNHDSYCFVTFFLFFIFENDVQIPSKSNNKQKKIDKKLVFRWHLGRVNDENSRIRIASRSGSESGSISQRHGSADPDPDPSQNVMDLQHWYLYSLLPCLLGD
jgi:hypothetical protein